ncbi:hypothetical protein [Streptomyces curacoi]|uniref:TPM domain-containing protein n=1 Tax=Streptomyces curacoi TaxID=146536 RepID=A0A124H0V8_9ACTN|nr:hypothetical protein [Streptomyces curacoi]KUM74521.1 hypothetical protein AQI70_16870 [Streptomyces curacoi]
MTSSLIRGRPRRGTSHISVRVVHALVGGLIGMVWLVLPGMTIASGGPVAGGGGADRPVAGAVPQGQDEETSAADLVLPVMAVVVAGVLAGYGLVRRRRRARERTTPGGAPVREAEPPVGELDERARALLVEADDWVRVGREELGFAEGRFGAEGVEPFARALRDAEGELAVAFRMRWQYEGGVPDESAARRHVLAGIVGRCAEAGRLLDAQAAAFDQLRGLEEGLGGGLGEALAVAEARFRELTGRAGGTDATLGELAERYAPSATAAVTGHVEQAKDRLVFATTRLNQARQLADAGENERAAGRLRAAEGAIAQAAVLIDGVDRLAGELATAATMVPAALTGGEAEIAGARESLTGVTDPYREDPYADVPPGELRARVAHADLVLAGVREELTSGPYDPLDLLRRIVRAVAPVVAGRAGVIPAAALCCAHSAVAGADDVVATHRAAVSDEARTRLAEARRLLAPPASMAPGRAVRRELDDLLAADTLARQARELAEQDVRVHGHPIDGPDKDVNGLAGAVLGGVLLGGEPHGGPPAAFGGPRTRGRRGDTDGT